MPAERSAHPESCWFSVTDPGREAPQAFPHAVGTRMSNTALVRVLLVAICCAGVSQARGDDAQKEFAAASDQYSAQHWEQAVQAFRHFAEQYPDNQQRGQARLLVGEALVQQGKFAEGYATLIDLIADHPKGAIAKQALFRAAEA